MHITHSKRVHILREESIKICNKNNEFKWAIWPLFVSLIYFVLSSLFYSAILVGYFLFIDLTCTLYISQYLIQLISVRSFSCNLFSKTGAGSMISRTIGYSESLVNSIFIYEWMRSSRSVRLLKIYNKNKGNCWQLLYNCDANGRGRHYYNRGFRRHFSYIIFCLW